MSTKSVRLDENVYEHIRAHKRDDETPSEAIERLISGYSLVDFAGGLTETDADRMREAIDEANDEYTDDIAEELGL